MFETLLHEPGIDICHETVRFWWNRFGPMFAREIRNRRVHNHAYSNWRSDKGYRTYIITVRRITSRELLK
jgi:transposase-like protein